MDQRYGGLLFVVSLNSKYTFPDNSKGRVVHVVMGKLALRLPDRKIN